MSENLPKLAVLVSGNGSNLQSIIDHIQSDQLKAKIVVVISNKPNVLALDRASQAGIPVSVVSQVADQDRISYDQALLQEIQKYKAEWLVLAGYMKILSPDFISLYPKRIINIHPSLLPKYPGLKAIEKALLNHEKETGVTIHYVNEGVDTGPIILQEKVLISSEDTLDSLKSKIQAVEHQIYPKALQKVLWGK